MQSPLPDPAPPTTCSASPAPATTAARAPSERREGTDENVQRTRTHHSDGTTVVGGHVEPTALIGSSIVLERTHTQNGCPRLEFTFKPKWPLLYFCFLLFWNLVVPCLLYYLLKIYVQKLKDHTLIGIGSAALGFSSFFDAPFRLWKLLKYRDRYGPLYGDRWYTLDCSMYVYTWAMFWFAIPLAIAPALELFDFFLFSTAMLVSPAVVVFALSLRAWRFPFPLSSDPPRTPSKPAVYYLLEDLVAVDFEYGKPWRRALQARYDASPVFRTNIFRQTVYWTLAGLIFVGATAAVVWATPLNFAFAFVLGQFFLWVILAGLGSWALARWDLTKEKQWWTERAAQEKIKGLA